ncbi:dethiobiotin synthase [Solimonas flava]|uniref:dethiobiotin synthase n=1 Tax=Solimonas flava TaxID=415849 RepID=UPI0003FF5051|nr:dethiobiotin synthase [Solimonas flava]
MSAHTLFVTGTDTGVGKTRAATALIRHARWLGLDAVGYKPVASGCERIDGQWRNDDALQLLDASGGALRYEDVNPVALPAAIAPHLAAREQGVAIDAAMLDAGHARLAQRHACVIVEGAGGWRVPLNEACDFADWVGGHRWPVVLVVGLRLGCINHALLTAEAVMRRTRLAGWVANRLPPAQPYWQDNLETLRDRLPAPCLGVLPENGDPSANCHALDTDATRGVLGLAGAAAT